jgi:methionine-rich copper-binding protein CopC
MHDEEYTMNKFHGFAAALTASLLWSAPSFAHAILRSSIPAGNAQLTQSPPTLTLNFSEDAQLAVLKLTSSGTAIPVTLDHNAKASSAIVVTLPALKPGRYDVQWSAIAQDDGHVTKGSFSFSVLGS